MTSLFQKKMPLAGKVSYSKTKSSGSVPVLPTVLAGLDGDKRVCFVVKSCYFVILRPILNLASYKSRMQMFFSSNHRRMNRIN